MRNLFLSVFLIGALVYGQDGSPDLSFGDEGAVILQLGNNPPIDESIIWGVDDNSNGKLIILAEYSFAGEYFYLISLLDNGELDMSWGVDGFLELEGITGPKMDGLAVLSDDTILIRNRDGNNNGLFRYLSDGSPDVSFGTGGFLQFITPSNGFNTYYQNDFIYYQCTTNSGSDIHIVLERYSMDGIIDTSYGTNGVLEIPIPSESSPDVIDIELLPDGGLVCFYRQTVDDEDSYQVVKFDDGGLVDTNYGVSGISEAISIELPFMPYSMLASSNGSSYLNFGYWDQNNEENVQTMFKIGADGWIDTAFGEAGQKNDYVAKIIQENGRILNDRPYNDWEGGYYPFYSRMYTNGFNDASFAFSPPIIGPFGSTFPKILKTGKLILASNTIWYDPESRIILQRLHNNPLGLDEFQQPKVFISPIPSDGVFQLKLNSFNQDMEYSIADISGKKIKTGTITHQNTTLDLSSFEAGMYFLHLGDTTYKLIKN